MHRQCSSSLGNVAKTGLPRHRPTEPTPSILGKLSARVQHVRAALEASELEKNAVEGAMLEYTGSKLAKLLKLWYPHKSGRPLKTRFKVRN